MDADYTSLLSGLFNASVGVAIGALAGSLATHWRYKQKLKTAEQNLQQGLHGTNEYQTTETLYTPSNRFRDDGKEYWFQDIRTKTAPATLESILPSAVEAGARHWVEMAFNWCQKNEDPLLVNGIHAVLFHKPDLRAKVQEIMAKAAVNQSSEKFGLPYPASAMIGPEDRVHPKEYTVVPVWMAEKTYVKELRLFYVPQHWIDGDFLPDEDLTIARVGNREYMPDSGHHQFERLKNNRKAIEFLRENPDIRSDYTTGFWLGEFATVPSSRTADHMHPRA
jgi:hypothetical protein